MRNTYKNVFNKKVVLITGGTGSFGKSFLRKIKDFNCEIRIFSRDELKQNDLRNEINNNKVKFYLGDIRDKESLFKATIGVDYAFHAAALKQVPSCEFFPLEAVKTNILGSKNLINCCVKNGVKKLVFLSTDKAVYPINAMGMTKALMEKTLISETKNKNNFRTKMSIVRYGNVMFSRGSVIPLFLDQIMKNEQITITHKEMTRFLLSLEDAIDLVLYAISSNETGNIFIKKAPSCKIINLAKVLLKIFNKKNKVKIIGTRHGEKIHETLASSSELLIAKEYKDYFKVPSDKRPLNYQNYYNIGVKKSITDDYSSDKAKILNNQELEKLLLSFSAIKSLT
tara:strand:- start:1041 stop:2060 length:1020 start_codon:yes stop_codon:yes gene_type:complete